MRELFNDENVVYLGNSLVVQWLGLRASTAGGMRSVPGRGTKILHVSSTAEKKKKMLCILTLMMYTQVSKLKLYT